MRLHENWEVFSDALQAASRPVENTKKQEKARQKEAILRYLDSIPTINNTEARLLLNLKDKDRPRVSRLFAELVDENEILQTEDS
jgi:ATP-dependent DNA helicase RecG